MIPTIPLGLVFNLFAGLLLGLAARELVRAHQGRLVECAALRVALVFEGLVIWPSILYFALVHADWTWMYLLDPHKLPRPALVLVLAASAAALVAGFAGGYVLIRAGKFRELYGALAAVGALFLLISALCRRRIFHYGTFADWRSGAGLLPILEVKLGYALVVAALATGGALFYAGYQLHLAGRRIS